MAQEKVNKWKVAAIIFLILFVLETAFLYLAFIEAREFDAKAGSCYEDICKDNLNAIYSDNICECLEYDISEEGYVVVETTVMDRIGD